LNHVYFCAAIPPTCRAHHRTHPSFVRARPFAHSSPLFQSTHPSRHLLTNSSPSSPFFPPHQSSSPQSSSPQSVSSTPVSDEPLMLGEDEANLRDSFLHGVDERLGAQQASWTKQYVKPHASTSSTCVYRTHPHSPSSMTRNAVGVQFYISYLMPYPTSSIHPLGPCVRWARVRAGTTSPANGWSGSTSR
jgi:hypothetical protein